MQALALLVALLLVGSCAFRLGPHSVARRRETRRVLRAEEEERGKASEKNSNVDMFAVSKPKPKVTISPPQTSFNVSSTLPSLPDTAPQLPGGPVASEQLLPASSRSATSMMGQQQSRNALQAEVLRLEAELEQMAIDEVTIDVRRKKLLEIDRILLLVIVEKTLSVPELVVAHKSLVSKEMYFRIAELANNARGSEEKQSLVQLCDDLLKAVKETDSFLYSTLTSDIEKEMTALMPPNNGPGDNMIVRGAPRPGSDGNYDEALQQWLKEINAKTGNNMTIVVPPGIDPSMIVPNLFPGDANSSFGVPLPVSRRLPGERATVRFPSAIPFNLLPLMLRSPELTETDFVILRDTVFTSDVLSKCVADHSVFLATFRGDPAGGSVQAAYAKAKSRIDLVPGLSDRVRLFLLPEYRISSTGSVNNTIVEKYTGTKFEPVMVALSRQAVPKLAGVEYPVVALSALASFVSVFLYATDVNSLNSAFVEKAIAGDEAVVAKVFAVIGGLAMLELAHLTGHYVAALVHKIKLGPPFLVPSLQIGTFGSVTRLLSFPPSRKALFDMAIAGPLVGFACSLGMLVSGLDQTAHASPEVIASFPALPTGFFSSSFLIYWLTDNFLHIADAARVATSLTPVHPYVVIGMTGVLINAYNMLPIGRLDGGRVAMAITGRQAAGSISLAALVSQGFALLSNASPVLLAWLLFVVFLQRGVDLPPEDDVTAVGSAEEGEGAAPWAARLAAIVFCSIVTGLTLLPVAPIGGTDPAQLGGVSQQLQQFLGSGGGPGAII